MDPEELASALIRLTEWARSMRPSPSRRYVGACASTWGGSPPSCRSSRVRSSRGIGQLPGRDRRVDGRSGRRGRRLAGDAGLSRRAGGARAWIRVDVRARVRRGVPLDGAARRARERLCVESGVWLVRDDEGPLVAMLKSDDQGWANVSRSRSWSTDRDRGEHVLSDLWTLMRERNVYRGRVLELAGRYFHGDEGAPLTVRSLPTVSRDRMVLPQASWSGSSVTRSASRSTPSGCGRAAAICAAVCCSTGRRARARPSPRCTSPRRCGVGPPSC